MALERWLVTAIAVGSAGEQIVNTFHYGWDNATPNTAMSGAGVANLWESLCLTQLFACVAGTYKYVKTKAECLLGPNLGVTGEVSDAVGSFGTRGTADSNMQCMVLKRISAFAGRSHRGRIFLSPSIAADFDTDGKFTGNATALNNLGDAMLLPLGTTIGPEAPYNMLPLVGPHVDATAHFYMSDYEIGAYCGMRRSRRIRIPN